MFSPVGRQFLSLVLLFPRLLVFSFHLEWLGVQRLVVGVQRLVVGVLEFSFPDLGMWFSFRAFPSANFVGL